MRADITRANPPADPGTSSPAHGDRVLVVEDNAVNQAVAKAMLKKLGYRHDVAESGQQALDVLAGGGYAAVLMDCQMPGLDGYETTAAIREREGPGPRTPIIAMTAHSMQGDRERCLAAGMDDYLSKPLRTGVLGEKLEAWMPSHSAGVAPGEPAT